MIKKSTTNKVVSLFLFLGLFMMFIGSNGHYNNYRGSGSMMNTNYNYMMNNHYDNSDYSYMHNQNNRNYMSRHWYNPWIYWK